MKENLYGDEKIFEKDFRTQKIGRDSACALRLLKYEETQILFNAICGDCKDRSITFAYIEDSAVLYTATDIDDDKENIYRMCDKLFAWGGVVIVRHSTDGIDYVYGYRVIPRKPYPLAQILALTEEELKVSYNCTCSETYIDGSRFFNCKTVMMKAE